MLLFASEGRGLAAVIDVMVIQAMRLTQLCQEPWVADRLSCAAWRPVLHEGDIQSDWLGDAWTVAIFRKCIVTTGRLLSKSLNRYCQGLTSFAITIPES